MKKYIYFTHSFRCRIKLLTRRHGNTLELQLQKKSFFSWTNIGRWMTIDEGFAMEDSYTGNPMTLKYDANNVSEIWKTGTLNLNERVKQFYEDYMTEQKRIDPILEIFKSI